MLEFLSHYFYNKSKDNRATSEAQMILQTVINSGFPNELFETSAMFWTIIISMDHSTEGLTTVATSWDKPYNSPPFFAHNVPNDDLHHVLKSLENTNTRNTFSVVSLKGENLSSLALKVWSKSHSNEKQYVRNIYEESAFVDSCKLMNSSLIDLAKSLPVENFI